MTVGYDSVAPSQIPPSAEIVFGYIDGRYMWTAADWALFPNAVRKTIATNAEHDADILDVEKWDATPQQAPAWCNRQRWFGRRPVVYCNLSTYKLIVGVVAPDGWWIADYTGKPHLVLGSIATQWADVGPYDISEVDPACFWFPPAPPDPPPPTPAKKGKTMLLVKTPTGIFLVRGSGPAVPIPDSADSSALQAALGQPSPLPLVDEAFIALLK